MNHAEYLKNQAGVFIVVLERHRCCVDIVNCILETVQQKNEAIIVNKEFFAGESNMKRKSVSQNKLCCND